MEDLWKRAKTFAEEEAKKSQALATSTTTATSSLRFAVSSLRPPRSTRNSLPRPLRKLTRSSPPLPQKSPSRPTASSPSPTASPFLLSYPPRLPSPLRPPRKHPPPPLLLLPMMPSLRRSSVSLTISDPSSEASLPLPSRTFLSVMMNLDEPLWPPMFSRISISSARSLLLLFSLLLGSEIYQENLSKALAKYFSARLLIVDSLSLLEVIE